MRFKEFYLTESKESREAMKRMNLDYIGYGHYQTINSPRKFYTWDSKSKRMIDSSLRNVSDREDFVNARKSTRSTMDAVIKLLGANLSKKEYNEKLKDLTKKEAETRKRLELTKDDEKSVYVKKEEKDEDNLELFPQKVPDMFILNILSKYKDEYYEVINSYLRNNKILYDEDEERIKRRINAIDEVIKKNKTTKSGFVYRLVEDGDYLKKDEIEEKGFLSTTIDKNYLEEQEENYENPVILRIKIPIGTHYTKTVFGKGKEDFENEILFSRNCILKKISDKKYELKEGK